MKALALIAAGGALGALGRHGVALGAVKLLGPGWPAGTLTINVVGGLVMGLVVGWLAFSVEGAREWRLFLSTGLLGGFTTFSAFALETALMIEKKAWVQAIGYVSASVALSVGAVFVGLWIVRRAFG